MNPIMSTIIIWSPSITSRINTTTANASNTQMCIRDRRGINSETVDNLDQDQKQVQRLDPYARERYFAVRDQQHAEDQVGNNGGQLREKRVEQPAGDHREDVYKRQGCWSARCAVFRAKIPNP